MGVLADAIPPELRVGAFAAVVIAITAALRDSRTSRRTLVKGLVADVERLRTELDDERRRCNRLEEYVTELRSQVADLIERRDRP